MKARVGTIDQAGERQVACVSIAWKADGTRRSVRETFDTRSEAWVLVRSAETGKRTNPHAGIMPKTLWSIYERTREGQITK